MRNLYTVYENQVKFKEFLQQEKFNCIDCCLVRIYTAICTKEEAVQIACEVKSLLPNGKIIGGSGSGVIFCGEQRDETIVIIEKFNKTEIEVYKTSFAGKKASQVARELLDQIEDKEVPLAHVLCGEHYPDIYDFLESFNRYNDTTKLVGGVVGDILSKEITGYVFSEEGVVEDGILVAFLINENLYTFNEVNVTNEPISPIYTINEIQDSLIKKIEKTTGIQWCREQFGLQDFREYSSWELIAQNDGLVRFPFIMEGHGGASRFIRYDAQTNEISFYFSKMKPNTRFRIGYTSPTKCVQECSDICNQITKEPIESLFCYTCLFRKLYLGNCAEWELRPFLDANICGVFMMGEIANINGRNEVLNGSCCFVGIAEEEKYVQPDFSVFEDLYTIKDDNQRLLDFVLQKQSDTFSNENKKLLEKLLEQQEIVKETLYLDMNTGLKNTIMFSEENQLLQFDKMCMIQVDNADLLIAQLGQGRYYGLLKKVAELVSNYTKQLEHSNHLYYYILNESTLFLVANEALSQTVFLDIIDNMYHEFHFINLPGAGELFVNRFAVVLEPEKLLERGISTLQSGKNMQTHFLICDIDDEQNAYNSNEMDMLQILNSVIKNDGVVPFFQGIYDNEQKHVKKYEALMRIRDDDGNIYAPAAFMDIAKKYHLYSALSKMMITKVLHIFSQSNIEVSINLSAYDINYKLMREFIFSKLEEIGDASNFVFEILEDENFRDMEMLKSFIKKAREYGVRIAIDDFGSGYSNFIEIAKMEPDYIKVDASIVKNIDTNHINQKVLGNIVFLGKQLEAEIVAEYVESEGIQIIVEEFGVRFSQGYLFAKPVAYHELNIEEK